MLQKLFGIICLKEDMQEVVYTDETIYPNSKDKRKFIRTVMYLMLDSIRNIKETGNIQRFMKFWKKIDKGTRNDLKELVHNKLLKVGHKGLSNMLLTSDEDSDPHEYEKKKQKVNPICQGMLDALHDRLARNEDISITALELAQLGQCRRR